MYASTRYFARSYFNGIWPTAGIPSLKIYPLGIEQTVQFGIPSFWLELYIHPTGIEQHVEFGTPTIGLEVRPTGIVEYTEFGTPVIELEVRPGGIEQLIEFGVPTVELGIAGLVIQPEGIEQLVEFGFPDIWREYIAPWPLEVAVKLVETEEFAKIKTRPYKPIRAKQVETEEFAKIRTTPYETPVKVKLAEVEEFAKINTRPHLPPVQFESLSEHADNILALSPGGNEMSKLIKVILKKDDTGQIISTYPVSVESLPTSIVPTRLDTLGDVNATTEVEGGVPRYDEIQDKYIVEKLDYSDLTGDIGDIGIDEIDGGTF